MSIHALSSCSYFLFCWLSSPWRGSHRSPQLGQLYHSSVLVKFSALLFLSLFSVEPRGRLLLHHISEVLSGMLVLASDPLSSFLSSERLGCSSLSLRGLFQDAFACIRPQKLVLSAGRTNYEWSAALVGLNSCQCWRSSPCLGRWEVLWLWFWAAIRFSGSPSPATFSQATLVHDPFPLFLSFLRFFGLPGLRC